MEREEFVKLYKEYVKAEQDICKFYRSVIGGCGNCPLMSFSCGIFDFNKAPVESVIEILDKWRHKNETNN